MHMYRRFEACVAKKRLKICFQYQLSVNAGQKYCRMHSAILMAFIKLPFVIKIFVLSILEWLFYKGFTVQRGIHYVYDKFICYSF